MWFLTDSIFMHHNILPLLWRHNGRDGVSNHQPNVCLVNRSVRHRSKKPSKLRVTGLCAGNSPVTAASHAEIFPFDDVIMRISNVWSGINWCGEKIAFETRQNTDANYNVFWCSNLQFYYHAGGLFMCNLHVFESNNTLTYTFSATLCFTTPTEFATVTPNFVVISVLISLVDFALDVAAQKQMQPAKVQGWNKDYLRGV